MIMLEDFSRLGQEYANKLAEDKAKATGEKSTSSAATGGPDDEDPEEEKKYNEAPYHHQQSSGAKSKAPTNGQQALDNSVPYGERGNRVSVDKANDEYIVLMKDSPGNYHGHVRNWEQLEPSMQKALSDKGLVRLLGSGQKAKIL